MSAERPDSHNELKQDWHTRAFVAVCIFGIVAFVTIIAIVVLNWDTLYQLAKWGIEFVNNVLNAIWQTLVAIWNWFWSSG